MYVKNIFQLFLSFIILTSTGVKAQSDSLFVVKRSTKDPVIVAKELKQVIQSKGLKIFSDISHHLEAKDAGEQLRFTEVITFGNPKVGTKLMQMDQRLGYVLPLKILIIQDEIGETQILYTDPKKYKDYYTLKGADTILTKMSDLLSELVNQVL